jgi:hypothetical protein
MPYSIIDEENVKPSIDAHLQTSKTKPDVEQKQKSHYWEAPSRFRIDQDTQE